MYIRDTARSLHSWRDCHKPPAPTLPLPEFLVSYHLGLIIDYILVITTNGETKRCVVTRIFVSPPPTNTPITNWVCRSKGPPRGSSHWNYLQEREVRQDEGITRMEF